jgi:uncharacterized protein YjiS (DUF1127 family)
MLQRHHNNHRADSRQLSPQQWAALEQDAARRAGAARTQAMRERLGRIADAVRAASASGRGLGRAMVAAGTATVRRSARAYATWRERRRAIGALGSLSDLALKDMGIYRCQIESLVYASIARNGSQRGRLASPATGKRHGGLLPRTSRADGSRRTPPDSCTGRAASTEHGRGAVAGKSNRPRSDAACVGCQPTDPTRASSLHFEISPCRHHRIPIDRRRATARYVLSPS